jgi:hypothetical protein
MSISSSFRGQMFSLVHAITDNPWAVSEATRDVIRDFAADGVVYLELRTTPRQVPGSGVLDPNPPLSVFVVFLNPNFETLT